MAELDGRAVAKALGELIAERDALKVELKEANYQWADLKQAHDKAKAALLTAQTVNARNGAVIVEQMVDLERARLLLEVVEDLDVLPPHIRQRLEEVALDYKEANEMKAGGTEKISGPQNDASRPAPRHVPPGPTDADERAMEYLIRWKRVFNSLGDGWKEEDEAALTHLRSRLAAPRVSVTREWAYQTAGELSTHNFTEAHPDVAYSWLEALLRSLGVVVTESGKEER